MINCWLFRKSILFLASSADEKSCFSKQTFSYSFNNSIMSWSDALSKLLSISADTGELISWAWRPCYIFLWVGLILWDRHPVFCEIIKLFYFPLKLALEGFPLLLLGFLPWLEFRLTLLCEELLDNILNMTVSYCLLLYLIIIYTFKMKIEIGKTINY